MKVSIIIPNWNGENKLRKNLPEVLKTEGVDEVIVVDDCSNDKSREVIKNFKEIKLIEKEKNTGFSSTVNLGVKNSKGEFIFLLNSDAVPEKNILSKITPHFKNDSVFSVGLNAGGSWTWAKFKGGFFWHGEAKNTSSENHQTLWVSGGSGVFRRDLWEKMGGLDELFDPFYEEDTDLGYRATKRGYLNIWEPKASVNHYNEKGVIKENFSKQHVSKVAQRNQLFFIWKNITNKGMIYSHILALIKQLLTHPLYAGIIFSALIHLPAILKERETEKKYAKFTDEEILGKFSLS